MNLSEISIKRPTIPLVILIITLLSGLFFGSQLKYELIPDITPPVLVVKTIYPGAGPEDVEKSVTIPLEDALAKMEGIVEVTSTSMEGISIIKMELDFNANSDVAIDDAKLKIEEKLNDLPDDVRLPSISKVDLSALPVITLGATSDYTDTDFFDLVDNLIQPVLSQVQGVANVDIVGGIEKEIKVNINDSELKANNLTLSQVEQMIGASNVEFPAGKIETRERKVNIRLSGKYKSLDELRLTTIGFSNSGEPIKLYEIAEIYEGTKDITSLARINGESAIGLEISKQKEANSVDVSEEVMARLKQLEQDYKHKSLKFTVANDNSTFTLNAAKAVGSDLIMAIVLVSLIMLLFLKSYRNTIFVIVTIPTSLIATFIVMYLFEFSLDLISLSSLSLVVGSVVDDAIVIIENIHRHMEYGKNRMDATIDSMKEIGLTLISTTAVLAAVFIPIALVSGITGQILREYAVTIVAAMFFSLLFTFTLVPLLTSRFAKIEEPRKNLMDKILTRFEKYLEQIARRLTHILKWVLKHKTLTTVVVLALFASSIYLVPAGYIGASFMDAGDRGNILMRLEFPKDIPLAKNARTTGKAEQILLSQPEVEKVYTTIGKRSGGAVSGGNSTSYYTEFNVVFVPADQREYSANILARILRKKIEEQVPGIKVSAANVNMMGNEDIPLRVYIKGTEPDSVFKATSKVEKYLASIEGTTEVESSVSLGNPELQVNFDRNKLAYYKLTVAEVSKTIQTAFAGSTDNKYRPGNKEYDINIRFDNFDRKDKVDLESLTFDTQKGKVQLKQFASIVEGSGPTAFERFNRGTSANVCCQLVGISQGAAQKQFEKLVADNGLPGGTFFDYSKRTKMMAESFSSLAIAFLAAIIFMYLIMVLLYNNWLHPFVVLFTVPLAIIGALYALGLANENLSLFTILGIIMLAGLVAKNAILVIDFANELQAEGKSLYDAVIEAVLLRFRAILMTNISMIIGLIPLAVSSGAGAEWKNGIGWVLIGGLTVSMFLSLVIVPMIYYVFENKLKTYTRVPV